MFEIYVIFFTIITTILTNYILSKTRVLIDKKYLAHKSFLTKNETPLSGGILAAGTRPNSIKNHTTRIAIRLRQLMC